MKTVSQRKKLCSQVKIAKSLVRTVEARHIENALQEAEFLNLEYAVFVPNAFRFNGFTSKVSQSVLDNPNVVKLLLEGYKKPLTLRSYDSNFRVSTTNALVRFLFKRFANKGCQYKIFIMTVIHSFTES